MTEPTYRERMFFGDLGFLYLYDIRFDPRNRAHCNPLPDGRVHFRLHAEPGFSEAEIVYNDGETRSAPLQIYARDHRFDYWEVVFRPQQQVVRYSFAMKRAGERSRSFYHGGRGLTHAVETQFILDLDDFPPFTTPDWMKGAVMYQIFPERFANGDPGNDPPATVPWGSPPEPYHFQGGDLWGILEHLDYLEELGVEVLYLNPINTSPSNHKYDAIDFYHVDPAFGGDDALKALVDGLHRRGMRIILDASFNHCYPRFFAFQDLVKNGASSRYQDWFTIHEFPVQVRLRPHLIPAEQKDQPHFRRIWQWAETFEARSGVPVTIVSDDDGPMIDPTYLAWTNVISMPKLNQKNPETRDYFLNVATYWLREFDIDGWRMDVAQYIDDHFWQDFRRVCKETRPDCILISEIWGDTAHWLQGEMFDGTMNYLFRELCLEYFAYSRLGTHEMMEGMTRLDSLYAPQVAAVHQNLLSSHDAPRFLHLAGGDTRRLRLATLFQLTMPGAPSLYYGDEIGLTGGEDPDNRRAFPWHDPDSWDHDLQQFMRELIHLRRDHSALKRGTWTWVWDDIDAFAFERRHDEERILVVINRDRPLTGAAIPTPAASTAEPLWGNAGAHLTGGRLIIDHLEAWSGAIWRLR